MIQQVREWETAKDEIILYKLKPGKKSPICNPHYYDENILEEFYCSYKISNFPEVLEARLLDSFEWDRYGLFIKNKLHHEIICWPLFSEEFGISYVTERYQNWLLPKNELEPKFWGIRPALVIKRESLCGIEFAAGDLLYLSKTFHLPYEPKKEFQHIEFFSALSNNILLLDKYIGETKFDPYLSDCSEINEKIDEWYIKFIDYFGINNI